MKKDKWIWMPHAGHFCCSKWCQFKLNTYVGKYIVSTVGEYYYTEEDLREVGLGRKYETMVFYAKKSEHKCCPYSIKTYNEIDMLGYNTAEDAYKGHLKLCNKWSKKIK